MPAKTKTTTNIELFENYPIPKAILTLSVPSIVGSLVMVIYSLADTFFVGMLNDELQSAAVSLAAPALLAFNAINNLFGVGSSSMMSRALGVKDMDTVRKSAAFGLFGALGSGIFLALFFAVFQNPLLTLLGANETTMPATLAYMRWAVIFGAIPSILNVVFAYLVRSEGASLHASIGTMSGCILNMILDPIFILPQGLGMGAAGAGFATFLSNCMSCIYFIILLRVRRSKTNIRLHPKYFTLQSHITKGVFSVGVPAAIQNLLNVTGMTILNNAVAGYGSSAVAAVGIAYKIQMMPLQIALGGTQGVMPLIGYSYSSRNKERFDGSIRLVRKILFPFMLGVASICWLFAGKLVSLFLNQPDVIAYGEMFLRGFAFGMPFMLLDFLAVGVFQSVGMGKRSLLFALLRKIVLEIPAIFILNYVFHAQGITYAGFVAELILAIYGTVLLKRIVNNFPKKTQQRVS